MQRFQQVFGTKLFSVIGMIHLRALPGSFQTLFSVAAKEETSNELNFIRNVPSDRHSKI